MKRAIGAIRFIRLVPARFLFLLLLFSANSLSSQQTFKVSGKIIADDLSSLSNASVYLSQFSTGTFTDSTGKFDLKVKEGWNEISFSYIGFNTQKINLFITRDTSIQIKLLTNLQLGEVTIVDQKQLLQALHDANGTIGLTRENFNSLPAFLGENDPIRAVQMQPGVQSGGEGSRGIFVRGGSPDQNLMLVDGAPVYNPSHVYGFISVFNGDAIERLDVYKDRYPARFGGRLCSVMDIKMEEGNREKVRGSFSLGLVTSRFHLDGPLTKKKNTTFSVSLRGCYVGLYSSPISKRQYAKSGYNGNIYYYFGDANAKLVHHFSDKIQLQFNFFTNNDFYSFTRNNKSSTVRYSEEQSLKQNVSWANYVGSAALLVEINDQWKMSQRFSFSRYSISNVNNSSYQQIVYSNNNSEYHSFFESNNLSYINDISWRGDVEYNTNNQTLMTGAGLTGVYFETGKGKSKSDNSLGGNAERELKNPLVKSLDAFLYSEDEYHPNERWLLNGGFHARVYTVQGKTFVSFLPRVNFTYNPVAKFFLRASASGLSQNLHLLATASSNILNDYWVPATKKARPENGWNFSGGMMHKLPLNFEWSIDGFYRIMNNVIEYKSGSQQASVNSPWEDQIITGGKGRSYGVEFYVARTKGRVTGSVAYTLAWSDRQFASLNDGKHYPYKYDRRHNLAVQLVVYVGKHIELGTSWVYGSGNRFTLMLQGYQSYNSVSYHDYEVSQGYTNLGAGERISVFDGRNNYRLPAYHHLDISFTYRKRKKNLDHVFNMSIYNVYNRFNQFSVYSDYRTNSDGSRSMVFKQLSLFPVLPSFSYTIKFS